jgi:uncharacterized phage infection (PIP) family protein YhgE
MEEMSFDESGKEIREWHIICFAIITGIWLYMIMYILIHICG